MKIMKFKNSYRHSQIATMPEELSAANMLNLIKSQRIDDDFVYDLYIAAPISKVRNLHFIHNNMLGDVAVVSPALREIFIKYAQTQPVRLRLHCKDGTIEDYCMINTLQTSDVINEERSQKIYLGEGGEYFIGDICLNSRIPEDFVLGRDTRHRTKLFYSERFAKLIKDANLDEHVVFEDLPSVANLA